MSKFKQFVQRRKSEIITGAAVASTVVVGALMIVAQSNKDVVRVHKGDMLLTDSDPDTDKLYIAFQRPDGARTETLSYKLSTIPVE